MAVQTAIRPRRKIILAAIVLSAGLFGAYLFRKPRPAEPPTTSAPEVAIETAADAPRWDASGPAASHLVGRIDAIAAPTQAAEPLQPAANDPEVKADRAPGEVPPAAQMPASPPWAGGDDRASIHARMASTSASPLADRPDGDELSPPRRRVYRTHRVVDGDTLSKLAQRYLGQADRYYEIYQANQGILRTPDVLPIGSLLRIPDPADRSSAPSATPGPMVEIPADQLKAARQSIQSTAIAQGPNSYRVQAQDTLAAIARHFYGDANRYRAILEANRDKLQRPEDLREGMLLLIP